jgi:alpha-D-ribose 1-methylphosphonate 5-phosphate C-P lyase
MDAIWDTGATNSVISQGCIDQCGLVATGIVQVHGVHGSEQVPTFLVNIILPNGVGFHGIQVTRGQLTSTDLLIGMDIISRGDFAVTNVGGITKFSFRHPSIEHIDYAANAQAIRERKDKQADRRAKYLR